VRPPVPNGSSSALIDGDRVAAGTDPGDPDSFKISAANLRRSAGGSGRTDWA